MYQSRSRLASTVQLTYIICSKSLQLERGGFCGRECSVPIKSALSFTAVAFREIPSTASSADEVITAAHRDTCCLAATWRVEQRRYTGRRPPRCRNWFLKTVFKITYNSKCQSQ